MDLDMTARVYALELLTTQLISEYLQTVPDPAAQTKWARRHLHLLAEGMPVETGRSFQLLGSAASPVAMARPVTGHRIITGSISVSLCVGTATHKCRRWCRVQSQRGHKNLSRPEYSPSLRTQLVSHGAADHLLTSPKDWIFSSIFAIRRRRVSSPYFGRPNDQRWIDGSAKAHAQSPWSLRQMVVVKTL
jgi:hypothetical protein